MKVTPFETYQTYLSMKSHFTNSKYDFFKYGGKSRATITSFNKRKDKYRIEKTSKLDDENIRLAAFSSFISEREKKDTCNNYCQNHFSFLVTSL